MTFKELTEQLGIPHDALIVTTAPDHGYTKATVELTTAILYPDGVLTEEGGDEEENEPGSKKIPVLVVS